MTKIYQNRNIESITKDEWKHILKKGAFRGHKINKIANDLKSSSFDDLQFKGNCVFTKNDILDLNEIKQCKSNVSLSRISHWFKNVFRKGQSDFESKIDNLANAIYVKVHQEDAVIPPGTINEDKDSFSVHSEEEKSSEPATLIQEMNDLKSRPSLTTDSINDFLDLNARKIASFASKNGEEWLAFSKEIRSHLNEKEDNEQVANRLNQLDAIIARQLGLESHFYSNFTSGAEAQLATLGDVQELILNEPFPADPSKIPAYFQQQVKAMRVLFKPTDNDVLVMGVPAQKLAQWINRTYCNILHPVFNVDANDLKALIPFVNTINWNSACPLSLDETISSANNLRTLNVDLRQINTIDFIDKLPHPEKLESLNLTTDYNIYYGKITLLSNLKNIEFHGDTAGFFGNGINPTTPFQPLFELIHQFGNLKTIAFENRQGTNVFSIDQYMDLPEIKSKLNEMDWIAKKYTDWQSKGWV